MTSELQPSRAGKSDFCRKGGQALSFESGAQSGRSRSGPELGRKDLRDLRNLSRAPILSYLQKQAQPVAPRDKAAAPAPARYPILAAFTPTRVFTWLRQYLSHRIGPRHPFPTYTTQSKDRGVHRIEDQCRIALAGDWATGTDEAESVAKLIVAFDPHYSIHLGDVYYVGGPLEVDENFLGIKNPNNEYTPCFWPSGSRGSFALNGNHEMYARGFAYFDRMLPKLGLMTNGKPQGQEASFFCLENDYWRIVALDTGYNSIGLPIVEYILRPDCALGPEQIAWLHNVVQPRDGDTRGIILLTHHQYYSRYDSWYTKPAAQLADFFKQPVLWFWGHEHRLAIYPQLQVKGGVTAFGRCIGHGGMPVDLPPASPKYPACAVEFVDERTYPNDENLSIGFNGYAQLTLSGDHLAVEYVDLHGTILFSEEWRAIGGSVQRITFRKH